ncbi:hypothetical protein GSI_01282 [Ganoderma sinense ZZ0214-1]|uniref:DUF6534 domain-containing protein n=1 Tax=Ganoderma sinense ZZ0214-1 TaxID=1077348 RepID=A0A2G8SVG8_9APHY|nr:hypothetical protein GSI_01282 [Ganoderma sinense ZZ0214-1]
MADPPTSLHSLLARTPKGLGPSWGAFFIGSIIGVFLNVFSLILGYKYFRLYPTDSRFLRWLVIIVLPLGLFQTVTSVYTCYWHLVVGHANPELQILENWSFIAFGPVSVVTIFLCQLFFAHRVFRLGGFYRVLAFLAALGMLTSLGMDIALTVECFILPNLLSFQPITWIFLGIYGATMFTDVILTCALVFMLWRRRSGRSRRTDTVIASIIAYTVSSGLVFTLIGVVSFVFALVEHGNLIYCALEALGVQVYVISMLTAIILRKAFAVRMRTDDELPTAAFEPKKGDHDGRKRRDQGQPEAGRLSTLAFVTVPGGTESTSTETTSGMVSSTVGQSSSQGASETTDHTAVSV